MRISETDRVKSHLSAARRAGTLATLTLAEWEQTINDFNGICAYCKIRPFVLLEHFSPIYISGTHVNNCLPACDACNKRKGLYTGDDLFKAFDRALIEELRNYLDARIPIAMEVSEETKPRVCTPKAEKGKYEGKKFLDYEEAGDYLGIRHTALYHYVTDMEIETHKFKRNRKRYLAMDDVKRIERAMEEPWSEEVA